MILLSCLVSLDRIPATNIDLAVPYAAEGPGPTYNTLGEIDGTEVVTVEGVPTYEVTGNLNMTTVSLRTHMTLSQILSRWLFSEDKVVPLETMIPPGRTPDEIKESNRVAFNTSEANATVAALKYLEMPVQVEIADVVPDSPAFGPLHQGDVITTVDSTPVTAPSEIQEIVKSKQPGTPLAISFDRGGETKTEVVNLANNPQAQDQAFLGVLMRSEGVGGVNVKYNLEDVGGPSAGLMFSLAVVDKLSSDQINGGKFVAGTGTIQEDGTVGPIGGIAHKVRAAREAGAEVFLAPEKNCAEATSQENPGITILKVKNLEQAIDQMAAYEKGDNYQTCN